MKLPFGKPKPLKSGHHLTGRDGEELRAGDYVIVGIPGDYRGIGEIERIDQGTFSAYVNLVPWLSPGFASDRLYVPETFLSLDKDYEERWRR